MNNCLAGKPESITDTVMMQSGVSEQIKQFPNAMTFKIEQIYSLGKCDQHALSTINSAIQKTLNRDTIYKTVSNDIQASLSTQQLEQIKLWYNSPLGKKITALEIRSSDESTLQKMRSEKDRLFTNQTRVALIKKIDNALNASNWAVNIDLQSTIALLGALAQIQHKNITANLVQFAGQLDEQKALLKPQVENSIHTWYLFTYQSLSNNELEEYIAFLEKKDTRDFNTTALKSLAKAITINVENFIIEVEKNSKQ